MVHGDDKGLRIPPKLASTQAIFVPIWHDDDMKQSVLETAGKLTETVKKVIPAKLDDRDYISPGRKFQQSDMHWIRQQTEEKTSEIRSERVIFALRDTGEKFQLRWNDLEKKAAAIINELQVSMFKQAVTFRENKTFIIDNYDECKEKNEKEGGFFSLHWCGSAECEAKIQDDTKATIRVIPLPEDSDHEEGKCILCSDKSEQRVIIAKAY